MNTDLAKFDHPKNFQPVTTNLVTNSYTMSGQFSSRAASKTDDLKTQINTECDNDTTNNQNSDTINLANVSNELLLDANHLGNTTDFLSKLKQLCQIEMVSNETNNDMQWVLVLIDCDDIGLLLNTKKISMTQTKNSINLLNASIYNIITKSSDENKIFGYHLGSDLFALFVCDKSNKMTTSIEIVENLLNIMQNNKESSFTISVGMGIQQIEDNIDTMQREWVLRAHINLLRAKENGKNCYFNNQNNIDPSKNNKEIIKLIQEANKLYNDSYIDKCDSLLNHILDTFDQETLLKQCITTKKKGLLQSVYHVKAKIIFSRKMHIANGKYRAYKANEWMKLCMKTFIFGNMSVECYYFHKIMDVEIQNILFPKIQFLKKQVVKQAEERLNNPNNHITEKYDLTLLTRKQSANPVVSKVTLIKGTPFYYAKQAFEHIGDISEAPLITFAFALNIVDAKMFDYRQELYEHVVKWDPTYTVAKNNLAYCLWSSKQYDECLDMLEKELKITPDNTWLLSTAMKTYRDSSKLHITKKMKNINGKEFTHDERIDKAIGYGQHLLDLVNNHGKWMRGSMFTLYASLLYVWSKDFDKNKNQQINALKVYEKFIKMDQQLGYDIINNWTRDLDKFEHELIYTIIEYWYLPNRSMHKHILDYVDLIETYFNQDDEKMRRGKIFSSIAPHGYFRKNTRRAVNGREFVYVSMRKPSLYDKQNSTGGNVSESRSVVASWKLDPGGILQLINQNDHDDHKEPILSTSKFSGSDVAKLAYLFKLHFLKIIQILSSINLN